MSAFLAKFAGGYVVCRVLYFALPDALLQALIHFAIAVPVAAIVGLVAPHEALRAIDANLVSPRATLEIVRGCAGAGVAFLLAAAIAAFPSGLKRKLRGVALGLAFVYALNALRIVGLYGVLAYRGEWFEILHLYIVPLGVIAAAAAFFGWWVLPRAAPA